MPAPTTTSGAAPISTPADCSCGAASRAETPAATGADRGRLLARLDRAVGAGQVTTAEASERRVQLLAR